MSHLDPERLTARWSHAEAAHLATCATCRARARVLGVQDLPVQAEAPALALGPFVLERAVASGAMGEVWGAVHRESGVPVALKLVHPDAVDSDAALQGLEHEIRVAAGLDHRNVVILLDHGRVDAEAAAHSDGRLVAGSPWLAMEYLSGGSLAGRPPDDFASLCRVLFPVLDALAHAHGRGVVHRDLKPANVLFGEATDLRPGLKLCDFGIAVRLGEGAARAGTLAYMAPEQLAGGDVGPWTDLFAVGVVAWVLATRTYPHHGQGTDMLARKRGPLPPFAPMIDVPDALVAWLAAMMDPRPGHRPASAREAAAALRQVATEPVRAERAERHPAARAALTVSVSTCVLPLDDVDDLDFGDGSRPADGPGLPLPTTWVPAQLRDPPVRLLGVGSAMLALRDPEPSGREAERDALWSTARRAEADTVQVVRVVGDSGMGASRLGRWLVQRCLELGAHGLVAHTPEALDDAVRLLRPGGPASLSDLALQRLVVVHVDDPPPGAGAAWAACIGRCRVPGARVVFVCTGAHIPEIDLDATIVIGPLDVGPLAELLVRRLALAGPDARRLAEHAEGSPARALSIAAALVGEGRLTWSPVGLRLPEDFTLEAPSTGASPHLVEARRHMAAEAWDAALPHWVEAVWERALQDGPHAASLLIDEAELGYERGGIGEDDPRRAVLRVRLAACWRIAGEPEECLRVTSALIEHPAADRWPTVVAKALLERSRIRLEAELDAAERDLERALEVLDGPIPDPPAMTPSVLRMWILHDLGRLYGRTGRRDEGVALLTRVVEDAAGESLEACSDAHLELALNLIHDPDVAERHVRAAMAINDQLGRRIGVCDCLSLLGHITAMRGDPEGARVAYAEAVRAYAALEAVHVAFPLIGSAMACLRLGTPERLAEGSEHARRAVVEARRAGWTNVEGQALLALGCCAVAVGDAEAAEPALEQAEALLTMPVGDSHAMIHAASALTPDPELAARLEELNAVLLDRSS